MTDHQPTIPRCEPISELAAGSNTPAAPNWRSMASAAFTTKPDSGYDRLRELKAFDDTKAGVKGLVDSGITAVPSIFHDPDAASVEPGLSNPPHDIAGSRVPVIDLTTERSNLIALVKSAAESVGFFQIINHGVPAKLLAETLASTRSFHEEPAEAKAPYYTRDQARRVRYLSNFHLYTSPAANWRDTLFIAINAPEEEIPPACRGIVGEYMRQVKKLGALLLELLSEALGLHPGYLEHEAGCIDDFAVTGQYYPLCPEPHLTMGTTSHSDPSFLTVLLQDDVGGLQVLLDDGSWVDVPPVPGALVVNIGDFLQIVSNDKFKSVEHRVLAMAASPRVSVAAFFKNKGCGVFKPIVNSSDGERPRFRSVTVKEFIGCLRDKGLDGRSVLENFRV